VPVGINMLFSNQKIFLDVKDYSRIDQLEADIRQFGGIIEKFLSKEITCIVTNRGRAENLTQQKDVSASTRTESRSLRPSACASRVLSRGQSLLMRSNSLKDASVCDPVTFAQTWGIKTVTLNAVLQAIQRQHPACTPSSPASKHSEKSHHVKKQRKFSGALVTVEDTESNSRPFLTKFSGPFVKFEDTQSNFRPFFHQYSTFPYLDFESDLSNGIFSCAKNIRLVAARKNVCTTANNRKQKAWCKRGYCECCDTMYDDLNQHLTSSDHQRFAEHVENFANLDKLIGQIHLSDSSVAVLPTEDSCRHHVVGETAHTALTECAEEMQPVNNNSPFIAAVESASCNNVDPKSNQSPDHRSEPKETAKTVGAVDKSASGKRTGSQDNQRVSVSTACTRSVNSENHRADSDHCAVEASDNLHSQRLPVHCDGDSIASESVDCCKTDEAWSNVKLQNVSAIANLTRGDDTSELISSNYVLNLLELLSSENSVDSAFHAQEAGCCMVEEYGDGSPLNSVAERCVPSPCSYDAARTDLLPDEEEHCHQRSLCTVIDNNYFTLMSVQNDSSSQFDTGAVIEQHGPNTDSCTVKTEQVSDLPDLPTMTSVDAAALLETSVSTHIDRNHNETASCNMKVDDGASVLPLPEVNNNTSYLSPTALSVDQPAVCAATVKTESSAPVYAECQVNSVCSFGAGAFLPPVSSSDTVAESFDLHDKLLTMAYGPNIVEHDNWQSCSSVRASCPRSADCVDFSTSSNNSFCLPLVLGLPLCLSEDSAPPADCSDAALCTPVHSCSDPFEKPTTFAADGNALTESTSVYQSSPFPGIISFMRSAQVNDSSQSSFPYMDWQTNIDANVASDKVDECLVQDKGDLQNISYPENKCDDAAKRSSRHGSEDCYRSTPVGTTQLETTLVDDDSCCIKSFSNIPCSPVSELSVHPENYNNLSVVEPHESCDIADPVMEEDVDADNDSASTLIYSCEHLSSSALEHASDRKSPDKNKSETTVDHREPSVSNASSTWKVISFVDCRMKLMRTEAAFPTPSTQNNNEVNNVSSVLEPESHDATEPVEQADVDDGTVSAMIYSSPALSVQEQIKTRGETIGYTTEPSESSASTIWKVTSFADCRMRLVRTKAIYPTSSTQTVSSNSRHWYANNSCNAGVQFLLSKTPDNVLSY